jgi:hypothetical protein
MNVHKVKNQLGHLGTSTITMYNTTKTLLGYPLNGFVTMYKTTNTPIRVPFETADYYV